MEEQKNTEPNEAIVVEKKHRNIWAIAVSVVVTALLVGVATYYFTAVSVRSETGQESAVPEDASDKAVDEGLMDAREEVVFLRERIIELETSEREVIEHPLADVNFPIVVFGRPGLLNNTERGRLEKAEIEQKLIEPITDYYNETEPYLLTLDILVPTEVGGEYEVSAIFADGVHMGFLYGSREIETDWWLPECGMGACEDLSEAFRDKYPQIIERL